VRSGSTLVVLPLNTLALIFVCLKPSLSMRVFVEGWRSDRAPCWWRVVREGDHQAHGVAERERGAVREVRRENTAALHLVVALSVSVLSSFSLLRGLPVSLHMIGSLMRLAVGNASSALR